VNSYDVEAWKISRDNMVFNPSGDLFASTLDDVIHVWDVKTAKELVILQNKTGTVQQVTFGADGTTLLSQNGDGTIRRWQVK
jgi:WD40 repeat protein